MKSKVDIKKQTKICLVCKREFSNRKTWESRGQWDSVVYCSSKCQKKQR